MPTVDEEEPDTVTGEDVTGEEGGEVTGEEGVDTDKREEETEPMENAPTTKFLSACS